MKDLMNQSMPWGVLGLAPTGDTQVVRRAYAALIRQYRPDSHPREFAHIRQAYELAQQQASYFSPHDDEAEGEAQQELEPKQADLQEQQEAATQPAQLLPEPVYIPVDTAQESRSSKQPAVYIPVADWDFAPGPTDGLGTTHRPVWVPLPAELPAHETTAPDTFFTADAEIQALIHSWNAKGEQAAISLLRLQLRQSEQATIDARMDYQDQLLHWLLTDSAPSLGLVFEGAQLLKWAERGQDIRLQLGSKGEQRMELLIRMAKDYVFCSRLSENYWERLLFTVPAPRRSSLDARRISWVALTASIEEARARLQEWQGSCYEVGLPRLLNSFNPAAVGRIQGTVIQSTDILMGALLIGTMFSTGLVAGDKPLLNLALAFVGLVTTVVGCIAWRHAIRWPIAKKKRAT